MNVEGAMSYVESYVRGSYGKTNVEDWKRWQMRGDFSSALRASFKRMWSWGITIMPRDCVILSEAWIMAHQHVSLWDTEEVPF